MGEKITLDTNILISALGWNGKPNKILNKVLSGDFTLVISEEQLKEVKEVLDYPKLGFGEKEKQKFLKLLKSVCYFTKIDGNINVVKEDSDDDIILETAVKGKSKYLVTGDSHLLKLEKYENVNIMEATEFLKKH